MFRFLARCAVCAASAAAVLLACLSESASSDEQTSFAPEGPPTLVNEPGLIVLKTGRTISGRISHSAGGFVVEQSHGTVVVPFDLAEFPARNIHEAVKLFHQRTPNPTAGFHVSLAEWCLRHQLLGEARDELRAALRLEPHRADARNMLRRIEETLEPPPPIDSAAITALPSVAESGFGTPRATSLAGLSRDTARQFIERVQPILMNKCGNAGCHGPAAENDFRLTRVRLTTGAHRVHAERNLAVTLNYIDPQHPNSSPLLVIPQGPHGRAGRTIFNGPAAADQLDTLRQWVRQVASERSAVLRNERRPAPGSIAARATGHAPATRAEPLDRHTPPGAALVPEPWPAPADDPDGDPLFRDAPPDAFDPEEFNRMAGDRRVPVRGRRGP